MATPDFTLEELESEQWRSVDRFPDYEISNLGRVRSYRSYGRSNIRRHRPRVLKGLKNKGYRYFAIRTDGKLKWYAVHQLVLAAFVGPKPEGMEACHADGVRDNNRLSNLRWDTRSANMKDALSHGTLFVLTHPSRHAPKLTASMIQEIKRNPDGVSQAKLARKFGVSAARVSIVLNQERCRVVCPCGKSFSHKK